MKNLVPLLLLVGSVAACETHGVVEDRYEGSDGSHLSLQRFKNESRFYYALSASMPSRDCSVRELKVVAMGADGHVRVRFEHAPVNPACAS
jgi:hypothetical protein